VKRQVANAQTKSLRPQTLSDFIGQAQTRTNLKIFIDAARARNEALDHVLLVGQPGYGKTTLAKILAHELGVNFHATSGPAITKASNLAAVLTRLNERDVLFIDEIHRLDRELMEIVYPAMEDFQIDRIVGKEAAAHTVKIDLAKFTMIAATTRPALLTKPFRDRFGIVVNFDSYSDVEIEQIVDRSACLLGVAITNDGANEIARRSRGTPRMAGHLLRRVCDFAHAAIAEKIDRTLANRALLQLDIDAAGLNAVDRRYLSTIAQHYGGGPVGVETLAAALSEPRDAIEDIIEPFLIERGFLQRTPRGRLITARAFSHLGVVAHRGYEEIEQFDAEPMLPSKRLFH
jgi:Holliday junction DNA helicase RuvB